MIWGIVIGLVVAGFIGLLTMVFTNSMANIWIGVLAGAVLGGILGWIWEKLPSRGAKAS